MPERRAGAGVYTYQLVRALAGLPGPPDLIVFARPGLFDDLSAQVVHLPSMPRTARLAWEQLVLPLLLRRLAVDVLHSPHHHTPLAARLASPRLRRVVTIHDVTFLLLPERYPLVRRLYMSSVTHASAHAADAFITPSQAVRNDAVRKLGLPADRVFAIPEAPAPQFGPVDDDALDRVRTKYQLLGRYILSVGSLEPGKNRARLINAFAALASEAVDSALVIAGQPAWHYEDDYALVRRLGLDAKVRFLGYVPDEDLPALYTGAAVFAFPSLYEGFGLPVLEAMACGTPVVTANVSATAEVAAQAALLIDPLDTTALTDALARVLTDGGLRADLRERGLERARQFSWERTARETLDVYRRIAAA